MTLANSFDLDGRLTAIDTFAGVTPVLDLDYSHDLAGNITGITDAGGGPRGRTFAYDELHRLTAAEEVIGGAVTQSTGFGYDAVGNRTERSAVLTIGSGTETYAYDAASNQLLSALGVSGGSTVQSRTLSHGDSGNRTADAASGAVFSFDHTMDYDASDRLVAVNSGRKAVGEYLHNALGQRVQKTAGKATTHFLYDLSGRLIAEYDVPRRGAPVPIAEYIAFEGMWLAYIATGSVYSIHADHLGTPQMLTDGAGLVAWSATYSPFGLVLEETGLLAFNLRLPGQYHDRETGYYYNYFRTYDPTTGRYVESDPIGLGGGWNTYGYVFANPTRYADPTGLDALCRAKAICVGVVLGADIGLKTGCAVGAGTGAMAGAVGGGGTMVVGAAGGCGVGGVTGGIIGGFAGGYAGNAAANLICEDDDDGCKEAQERFEKWRAKIYEKWYNQMPGVVDFDLRQEIIDFNIQVPEHNQRCPNNQVEPITDIP